MQDSYAPGLPLRNFLCDRVMLMWAFAAASCEEANFHWINVLRGVADPSGGTVSKA